jgi:hypothetical protein
MSWQCSNLALQGPQTDVRKSKVLYRTRPTALNPCVPKLLLRASGLQLSKCMRVIEKSIITTYMYELILAKKCENVIILDNFFLGFENHCQPKSIEVSRKTVNVIN